MKEKTIVIATVLAATMLMAAFAVIPSLHDWRGLQSQMSGNQNLLLF